VVDGVGGEGVAMGEQILVETRLTYRPVSYIARDIAPWMYHVSYVIKTQSHHVQDLIVQKVHSRDSQFHSN